MIRELVIKNLALIDLMKIELREGFSVFTGETGAGKSILIGAIGLLLGERASANLIRKGTKEMEISGVFELDQIPSNLAMVLNQTDIPLEENTLIIRRIITQNGRNRIHINQIPIPLSTLKSIGNYLIDLHGQHEHQSLLKPEMANTLINTLPEIKPFWRRFKKSYKEFNQLRNELHHYINDADELAKKKDLIHFQYNELMKMELKADEENKLEEELSLLSSVSQRLEKAFAISQILDGSSDHQSLDRQLIQIRKNLESLARYDPSTAPWIDDLESSISFFSELSGYCSSYIENLDSAANPEKVEQLNLRMVMIQRLKKKYHCSFEGLIVKQKELKNQYEALANREINLPLLEQKVTTAQKQCKEYAEQLSQARKNTVSIFDQAITNKMGNLGFQQGKWKTSFITETDITANGFENIVFEVQTNIGEPFLPLYKTASGGEISRLMLAIKSTLAENDTIPILIFDEIDSGIGGLLAKEVAKSLYSLSRTHQVLCISHLHQIASVADNHFRVSKVVTNNRTVTNISALTEEDKIIEISRMLGSSTAISQQHAQELLATKGNCKSHKSSP